MIGSDVLLFPDTGEQFARCLKTATLYSERIYCVSAAAPEIQEIFANEGLEPGESTLKFLAAAEQHEGDFALLRRENILPQEDAFSSWDEPSDEEWNAAFIDVLLHGIIRDHVVKHLVRSGKTNASSFSYSRRNRAMNDSPPAAWFAFQDLLRSSVISEDMKEVKKKIGASTFERILYDLYLKGLVTMADLNGVSILTHSEVFARSINDARNQPSFTRNPTHEDTAKAFLGTC